MFWSLIVLLFVIFYVFDVNFNYWFDMNLLLFNLLIVVVKDMCHLIREVWVYNLKFVGSFDLHHSNSCVSVRDRYVFDLGIIISSSRFSCIWRVLRPYPHSYVWICVGWGSQIRFFKRSEESVLSILLCVFLVRRIRYL